MRWHIVFLYVANAFFCIFARNLNDEDEEYP